MQKYQRTGTLVLIWAVPSDLTAQIRSARGAAAEGRQRPSSAEALRGSSPDLAKLGRPGSNRPVFGSGVTYGARVVHLGSKPSSGRLGAAPAWAAAGPRGGDSPARAFWAPEGPTGHGS